MVLQIFSIHRQRAIGIFLFVIVTMCCDWRALLECVNKRSRKVLQYVLYAMPSYYTTASAQANTSRYGSLGLD